MKRIIAFGVVVLALITCSTGTEASTIYYGMNEGQGVGNRIDYTNAAKAEQDFLKMLGSRAVTETFEGFANQTKFPATIFSGAATLQNYSYNPDYNHVNSLSSGTYEGRYPISGSKYLETGYSFTLTFVNPIIAFGFYGIDIGDYWGSLSVYIDGVRYDIGNTGEGPSKAGGVLYWGFIAERPFTTITFENNQPGSDYFGFDNFTFATAVPIPPSILLLGSGLVGLIGLRRKFFRK